MFVPAYKNNTLYTHGVQAEIILTVMLNDDGKDIVRGLTHLTCICTVSLHLVMSAF